MDEPQIIKTPAGEELVVLTRQDYDNLLNELAEAKEDLADIATYDERMAELAASPAPYLPAEVSPFLLEGHSRVSAFRHWRGLSLSDFAKAAAVEETTLARIEAREQTPTPEQVARLATALDIPTIWIEP
jgi:DNA-binding XRE family transcriptional regulator